MRRKTHSFSERVEFVGGVSIGVSAVDQRHLVWDARVGDSAVCEEPP